MDNDGLVGVGLAIILPIAFLLGFMYWSGAISDSCPECRRPLNCGNLISETHVGRFHEYNFVNGKDTTRYLFEHNKHGDDIAHIWKNNILIISSK